MVLLELAADLITPETCYQAESAEECFVALKAWREALRPVENMTISSAVQRICCAETTPDIERAFSRLSVLNMFTIVSALYAMTFRVETSLFDKGEGALIQTGLRHWRKLWPSPYRDDELAKMGLDADRTRWKRVGFMRYAPEFWLLTHLVLDRTRSKESEGARANNVDVECEDMDMAELDALITEFQGLKAIQT
ncbi:hypothetical protein K469DRAFT_262032 [Zopfia rhizophila CBS 207.26]|uniref:Transcription factor domain-containing protein n=1 Tax=Zopfia rhizophila CBS 207.26 TaxID=1314779 RepID=A0A6A6DUJ1_9PEZI|nr:hypothetical protein K469DRAFT_262032 [Zopfia rhizophila CBS 207.26]